MPDVRPLPNEIYLPVDDSYEGLPQKVKAVMGWAIDMGYESILKLDDDVYLVPKRFELAREKVYRSYDYIGNFRARMGGYPHDYASGFAYFLSRKAMELVASAPLTQDPNEDRWVGQILANAKVRPYDEKRFCCTYPGIDAPQKLWSSPVGRQNIAFAQYPADKFPGLHFWYKTVFHA